MAFVCVDIKIILWYSAFDKCFSFSRREPQSLVKPHNLKHDANNNVNDIEERFEKVRATASRHLIFIRHGQYNLDGATDSERYLTQLGKSFCTFCHLVTSVCH